MLLSQFKGTENETCVLTGFTVTGGATDARGGGISGNGTQAGIYHCTIENNSAAYGGGIDQCHGRIEKCIIRNNSASVNGGGLAVCGGVITNCLVYDNAAGNYGGGFHYCNGTITNCTVSENTAATNGGGLNNCNGVITNSIIWGNSFQGVFNCSGMTYCCYPGGSGTGNIDTDPLFVDVAGGDYHLLPSSPGINAGNPNYVPEPNETDLDGNARIFSPMVDMGCYEFPNALSVAEAGADITAYAWIDGYALVGLNGTASFDEDGDALEYYWYDANELIATGAEPNVVLPVGEHEITLIVNDGIWNSQPDTCTITIIEPFETTARMLPGVINLKNGRSRLMGRIEFAGETMPVLDPNQPMLLLVGDAEIEAPDQKLVYSEETVSWYLMGSFASAAIIENLAGQTEVEVTLITRFEAGQWVYGKDVVKVKY